MFINFMFVIFMDLVIRGKLLGPNFVVIVLF